MAEPHVLRRIRGDERGIGIVTALLVVLVVFSAGVMWTGLARHQIDSSASNRDRERAFAAAEAGLHAAMSRLATDATDCSDIPVTAIGDAEYEVIFDPTIDCTDPTVDLRYIVARGYAPSKDAPRPERRQLEQQLRLVPEQGFTFALFSAPQGITAGANMTVIGDVFSSADINLANSSKIFGDLVSLGSVTVNNNSVVDGKVHAVDGATLAASGATVGGDVWSVESGISTAGWVKGNAWAAGSIATTGSGRIDGVQTPNQPGSVPYPRSQTLPTFDPSTLTYTSTWTSASSWKSTVWAPHTHPSATGLAGAYRLSGSSVGSLSLDSKWNMAGDVTIVSDGPLDLSRDVTNLTGGDVTLAFISLSSSDSALSMTNNLSLPQNIKILFFAPNGCVSFRNLKHFTGTVYARCLTLDNQFTLTFHPVEHPGFTWTMSSAGSFGVEAQVFREVRFSG